MHAHTQKQKVVTWQVEGMYEYFTLCMCVCVCMCWCAHYVPDNVGLSVGHSYDNKELAVEAAEE